MVFQELQQTLPVGLHWSHSEPKEKNYVKKNTKEHTMKLRNKEKYHVTYARTVRLQKSSIQVMTKHLNKKHKENELMSHIITSEFKLDKILLILLYQ